LRAEESRREEGRLASLALRIGVRSSGSLMALAVAWSVLRPADVERARSLALVGVAALVATPFLRVVLLAAAFGRGRQWRMLAVSLAVGGLLLAGVVLGLR
jgi:hypothetical protein